MSKARISKGNLFNVTTTKQFILRESLTALTIHRPAVQPGLGQITRVLLLLASLSAIPQNRFIFICI